MGAKPIYVGGSRIKNMASIPLVLDSLNQYRAIEARSDTTLSNKSAFYRNHFDTSKCRAHTKHTHMYVNTHSIRHKSRARCHCVECRRRMFPVWEAKWDELCGPIMSNPWGLSMYTLICDSHAVWSIFIHSEIPNAPPHALLHGFRVDRVGRSDGLCFPIIELRPIWNPTSKRCAKRTLHASLSSMLYTIGPPQWHHLFSPLMYCNCGGFPIYYSRPVNAKCGH